MAGSNGRLSPDQELKLRELLAYVELAARARQRLNVQICFYEDGSFGIGKEEFLRDPKGPIPGRFTGAPEGVVEVLPD